MSSPAGDGGKGAAVSGRVWCSQKLIFWATPSSVMVKSLALSPSIGLPLLSLTVTASTTRRTCTEMVFVGSSPGGLFCPVNCAATVGSLPPKARARSPAARRRRRHSGRSYAAWKQVFAYPSEPQAHGDLHGTH